MFALLTGDMWGAFDEYLGEMGRVRRRYHYISLQHVQFLTWWRHQMEAFSALLAICAGNLPVTGEFPPQRPVTRSLDVFFDLSLNKRLSK